MKANKLLIESDDFEFEFLSKLGERESWRKEIHRPIYHIHKWWAKRLGSIFRGILLGSVLPEHTKLEKEFYYNHDFSGINVFDPFMGSGTTIGEAWKLGFTSLGRDINPVAAESVRVALGKMTFSDIRKGFQILEKTVGKSISQYYQTVDSQNRKCSVLYFFWVMQCQCIACKSSNDLFSTYVIASNAYPKRKPEVRILCPSCGEVFTGLYSQSKVICPHCSFTFNPLVGPVKGSRFTCGVCNNTNSIIECLRGQRPDFRLYAKLILTEDGRKEYLKTTVADQMNYIECTELLLAKVEKNEINLPNLQLEQGHNTKQAISYGFRNWKEFFNDRQLLLLGTLHQEIVKLDNKFVRDAFLTLFSSTLEFNNLFTSYKGEGTGAVRHMFSHHVLKPERVPIEANIWGTDKSSGSFAGLYKTKILRAIEYKKNPKELRISNDDANPQSNSAEFSSTIFEWPKNDSTKLRPGIYLSCGDSAKTNLSNESIDLIITDPPFFDNVHYSELADFFYSWQVLSPRGFIGKAHSTRNLNEVQDKDSNSFSHKLQNVFSECFRILKKNGVLVFTYHHSKPEGWSSVAKSILGAGFIIVNSHPVKSEMSVATPKAQAKSPIQLDIVIVCRKNIYIPNRQKIEINQAHQSARNKIKRMESSGFTLSENDKRIIIYGQLLTTLEAKSNLNVIENDFENSFNVVMSQLQTRKASSK